MKKCILLLLLAVHLNAFGQILSKIRPVNLTAQQDSIVRGFASQYRPIYTVDGHFYGYFKLDASAPSSTASIMLQNNSV